MALNTNDKHRLIISDVDTDRENNIPLVISSLNPMTTKNFPHFWSKRTSTAMTPAITPTKDKLRESDFFNQSIDAASRIFTINPIYDAINKKKESNLLSASSLSISNKKYSNIKTPKEAPHRNTKSLTKKKNNDGNIDTNIELKHDHNHDDYPTAYTYSSNNNLALLYIADDYLRKTSTSESPFKTFNELSKTNYNPDNKKLKKILRDQEKTKHENDKRAIAYFTSNEKKDVIPIIKSVGLIKQQLDYNKNQEILYNSKIDDYVKHLYEPFKLKIKQEHDKISKMPKIKIFPSKKNGVMINEGYIFDNKDEKNVILSINKDHQNEKKAEDERKNYFSERVNINILYKCLWLEPYENTKWRPDVREGATFTSLGKHIILYGGISNFILEDICSFDPSKYHQCYLIYQLFFFEFNRQKVKQSWQKLPQSGETPLFGRHGHTVCEYKNTLAVFGGERRYNQAMRLRECLNDLRTYNPDINEWKIIKSLGKIIEPRRNHGAAVHDKTMFVYGGINNYGTYLKDLWALSFSIQNCMIFNQTIYILENNSWNEILVENEDQDTPTAFHTMNSIHIDRTNLALKEKRRVFTYAFKNELVDRDIQFYPEGFYIFGGKDNTDKPLNTLKILRYESKIYSWYYPDIKGIAPLPRYKHVAVFYEPLSILLIHGGRNDTIHGYSDNFCLSDICILNLEYMQWAKVTAQGYQPNIPRCSHNAVLYNSSLLIFGGFNGNELCGSVVRYVELNQSLVKSKLYESTNNEFDDQIKIGNHNTNGQVTGSRDIPIKQSYLDKELSEKDFYTKSYFSKDIIKEKTMEILELDKAVPIKDEADDPDCLRKKLKKNVLKLSAALSTGFNSSMNFYKNKNLTLSNSVISTKNSTKDILIDNFDTFTRKNSPQKEKIIHHFRKKSLPEEFFKNKVV